MIWSSSFFEYLFITCIHFSFILALATFTDINANGVRGVVMRSRDGQKYRITNISQVTWNRAEIKVKEYRNEAYFELTKLN